jgi:heme/copper-type cytochrome/quinol oxidase subunit 2
MNTSSALDPQSLQARAIYDLGIVSTIVFVLIFVIVTGAIIYAIFRFRVREGEPDPKLDWARFFCFDLGGMTLLLLGFGSGVNAR